nr:MAG TPA: protein of unknown function (DUF4969) [Caudoviricetes sp.]
MKKILFLFFILILGFVSCTPSVSSDFQQKEEAPKQEETPKQEEAPKENETPKEEILYSGEHELGLYEIVEMKADVNGGKLHSIACRIFSLDKKQGFAFSFIEERSQSFNFRYIASVTLLGEEQSLNFSSFELYGDEDVLEIKNISTEFTSNNTNCMLVLIGQANVLTSFYLQDAAAVSIELINDSDPKNNITITLPRQFQEAIFNRM